MEIVAINAELRSELGKKAAKKHKTNDLVPGVIYGGGNEIHFVAKPLDLRSLIYTPDFKICKITIEGKTYRCIVKARQFHPVTDRLQHVDLLLMTDGNPIKVDLPVRFTGASPGVKAGGKFLSKVRTVKVKALPENLVGELSIDISGMELGSSVRVRDIKAVSGLEIMTSGSIPVASIEIPRALRGGKS